MKKSILFIIGTRPEAIKLAPLIIHFKKENLFKISVCSTGQHKEMLNQVFDFFNIAPDFSLDIMTNNQGLSDLTAKIITSCDQLFKDIKFDLLIVQGDTTTVLSASLVAFYNRISIAHIEAGLRTFNKTSPFPEEMNRLLTSRIADFHFCPTITNLNNLKREGITENCYVVGNTVIDALFVGLNLIKEQPEIVSKNILQLFEGAKKTILLTAHRRENFGYRMENMFKIINEFALENSQIQIIFPVHLNPQVQKAAKNYLTSPNIYLLQPLNYSDLIYVMDNSYFIITDSGGIQEEGPSLKKPIIVLRENTERDEGVSNGNAVLVGNDIIKLKTAMDRLIIDKKYYTTFTLNQNPFGDGKSSEKIYSVIKDVLFNKA